MSDFIRTSYFLLLALDLPRVRIATPPPFFLLHFFLLQFCYRLASDLYTSCYLAPFCLSMSDFIRTFCCCWHLIYLTHVRLAALGKLQIEEMVIGS